MSTHSKCWSSLLSRNRLWLVSREWHSFLANMSWRMNVTQGVPRSFALWMSSLYRCQKSEDFPILESLKIMEGPSLRKDVSSLSPSIVSLFSSNSGRSPAENLSLIFTKAAFCFSNHAQLLLGSPAGMQGIEVFDGRKFRDLSAASVILGAFLQYALHCFGYLMILLSHYCELETPQVCRKA